MEVRRGEMRSCCHNLEIKDIVMQKKKMYTSEARHRRRSVEHVQ